MKYIITILILISIAGCKTDVVDSNTGGTGTGETLLFEKSGRVDSIKGFVSAHPFVISPFASINFSTYSKLKVTFQYKATADSLSYYLYKSSDAPLFTLIRRNINTMNSYNTFDSTFTKPDTANGTYYRHYGVFKDTCMLVVRDLKIYGVN